MNTPLKTIKAIGDKLIRDTPFQYELGVKEPAHSLDRMHCVNFGRSFGLNRPATAYAWTTITAHRTAVVTLELEHNDACKMWLNG